MTASLLTPRDGTLSLKLNETFIIPYRNTLKISKIEPDLPLEVSIEVGPEEPSFKGMRWGINGDLLSIQLVYSETTSRATMSMTAFPYQGRLWSLGLEASLVGSELLRVTVQLFAPAL
jgi:hypothetical protein